jgi:hypothetical protein
MHNSKHCQNRVSSALILRLLTLAVLAVGPAADLRAQTLNPGVIDPWNTYAGRTYSQWAAAWGQYYVGQSTTNNPLVYDPTRPVIPMSTGQSGPVWFTGWQHLLNNAPQTRTFSDTMPGGIALFLGIAVGEWDNANCPYPDMYTTNELFAFLKPVGDGITNMTCTIDGMAIAGLTNAVTTPYREQSSFDVTVPAVHNYLSDIENLSSCYQNANGTPYTVSNAVDDGMFLMIAPLSAGLHVIHYANWQQQYGFIQDVTRYITVEPVALTINGSGQSGKLVLSWPQTPDVYALEASSTLNPAVCKPATNLSVTLAQGIYQATASVGPTNQFFRLHMQ